MKEVKFRKATKPSAWEEAGLYPLDRHPRTGKLKPSLRRGRNACQKGSIHLRTTALVGVQN